MKVETLSDFQLYQCVYGWSGTKAAENLIFQSKNRRGDTRQRACVSVRQLVKTFLTSWSLRGGCSGRDGAFGALRGPFCAKN